MVGSYKKFATPQIMSKIFKKITMYDKFYFSAALFLIFVLLINLFSPKNQLLQSECQFVYNLKDIENEFYKSLSLIKEKYPNQTSKLWNNLF